VVTKMGLEEYKGVYVFAQQVDNELSGIAFELLGKAKELTPVQTGRLRDAWNLGTIEKRGDTYYIEIYNNVEYAEPVEYGHRMKGGGFKKGAHMLEVSLQEMDRKLPDYLRAWLADFLNTHDLV